MRRAQIETCAEGLAPNFAHSARTARMRIGVLIVEAADLNMSKWRTGAAEVHFERAREDVLADVARTCAIVPC